MTREKEFKNAISEARRIWNRNGVNRLVKARSSPVVRFRNQANINLFKRAMGGGIFHPPGHTRLTNAPNGRRLRVNTNYVIMRSFRPFHPYNVRLNFLLDPGYFTGVGTVGLASKANVNRIIQNLTQTQLNNEMKKAKRYIAAAKVSQILGNAITRRRKLKNNMVFMYGLWKVRKYNANPNLKRHSPTRKNNSPARKNKSPVHS